VIDSKKLVRELIKGNLKKSKSYFSELETLSYTELINILSDNPKAKKMLK